MKLSEKIVFLVLLLSPLILDQILAEYVKNLLAICEKCDGICNAKFCKINATCRPLNRTSKWRTLDITFHEGIVLGAPLILDIVTYKKFRTVYRPLMVKVKLEYCHQLVERNHPFFKFVDGKFDDGTLFDPCPLKGHRYGIPGATISQTHISVPAGEWKIETTLSKILNNTVTHIMTVSFYYTVKSMTAEEF